ncbi:MAG: peptide chain release factor 1 [Deltaproteobacteria bacterium CG2_30_63_29]|nr:MAG: peptide chain release factor 1 [Deltaproteobacteria bacterium CG2_30_63_29]PJB34666.1 MAG: peptide chain release factor 1 [Deltaproteobacteria bacterium CG_4_9_14_3_um_filter_63_12]
MFGRLDEVERRFDEVSNQLADPAVLADTNAYVKLAKQHAELSEIVTTYRLYKSKKESLEEAKELLRGGDPELKELAREELPELQEAIETLDTKLRLLLIPKDPLDEKNIILEIRAGTGGDEAALFAGDLFEMYSRYAGAARWRVEILSASPGPMGGFKEVIALISGDAVYSCLKFEAGTHRVQRVPTTESQGRIHTSACTVAVLPEAEDVDIQIEDKDLQIDTYRSSGAGGQHVNTTDSAVRITHLPTGVVVMSQDERSQHKNKARAMKVLKSRLLDFERTKLAQERATARKSMVGTGDRSERIRTYNFPQNRITDHRINLTVHSLDRTLATGDINDIVTALRSREQAERLQEVSS